MEVPHHLVDLVLEELLTEEDQRRVQAMLDQFVDLLQGLGGFDDRFQDGIWLSNF